MLLKTFLSVLLKKKTFRTRTKIFLQTGIRISIQLKLRHAAGARARAFLDFKYLFVTDNIMLDHYLKTNLSMAQHNDEDKTIHLHLHISNKIPQKAQCLIQSMRAKKILWGIFRLLKIGDKFSHKCW